MEWMIWVGLFFNIVLFVFMVYTVFFTEKIKKNEKECKGCHFWRVLRVNNGDYLEGDCMEAWRKTGMREITFEYECCDDFLKRF